MANLNDSSDSESSENDSNVAEESSDEKPVGNPGLADALTKAIRMGKSKNGKSIVLSKAKLYTPKTETKKSHGFEIEPNPDVEIKEEKEDVKDVKPDIVDQKPSKDELKKLRVTKQEKLKRGRLKPSPLDREKERPLVKIATKGVVQLFNAVRQQQSAINKQVNKPGLTEGKKEKILKAMDKKAFLDVLMGKTSNNRNSEMKTEDSSKEDDAVKSEPEEEPSWQVLRDDFMMGAKLKDWDKKEIEVMEE